jgi:RHS repeat-associated protein
MSTDPLFVKLAAEYYWYHNDYLGTPQMITDISGAVVWKAALSSFGKSEPKMSFSVVNPFRFAGQYYDDETEFHYNWNRYYDPELGLYLRRDPILNEEVSGLSFIKSNLTIPANFNSYLYSIQNPLRYSDSTGLACGPGWLGDIIVDDYKFGSCCQKHDDCYSGKPGYRCKKRKDCDNDFCQCMNETCEKVSDRGYCRTKSRQYCGAVKRHGASHYFVRSCNCPATDPKTKK